MKKLNDIPEKTPFKVPDGYFEEVNRKIISAASVHDPVVKKAGLYRRFRPYFLAAASIAGFVILGYGLIRTFSSERKVSHASAIFSEDYAEPYVNDVDIYSLEENAESLIVSEDGLDVNKPAIIEYLIQDNIDINEIYEQL